MNIGEHMESKSAYKVETSTKTHWFKTYKGAVKFAARHKDWKVEIPSSQSEYEFAL